MSISIDEQIKLLEEQISGLKKQRDTNTKKAYLDLLEEKIRNAEKLNIKIKAIYVSTKGYHLCQSFLEMLSSCITPPVPFYYPPIKYRGYVIRVDNILNDDEINIAVKF